MCGRYGLTEPKLVAEEYGLALAAGTVPRYNISPTQDILVVEQSTMGKKLANVKWGIIPRWAADTHQMSINARAETVADKPTFRKSFRSGRILIPASGYYEWKRDGKDKTPYWYVLPDRPVFSFAGILGEFRYSDGRIVNGTAIITTVPNDLAAQVHDRMPVILEKADEERWLETPEPRAAELLDLLIPYPSGSMRAWEVGNRVNTPAVDEPALMEQAAAVGPKLDSE